MPQTIRPATPQDIPRLIDLLLVDAQERFAVDRILWTMADDAPEQIKQALTFALTADAQPFRQFWQVAEDAGRVTGVIHSMLLPVPPIYAGQFGDPGLILPDSVVVPDAPDGTVDALLAAAEDALRDAGAQITLSSYVTGADWRHAFQRRGYDPLTLYLSRTDLSATATPPAIRLAAAEDVPGIVRRSAENRQVLFDIDTFWDIHPDADARFSRWMTRSLTLRDRDMFVSGPADRLDGYVIAQPASRLHFPPAHDIGKVGVIDDYYHPDMADPTRLANVGHGATTLLRAAEGAFAARDVRAAFVVCPAGWQSKIDVLTAAGFETAMIWSIKR
ncbi:hypothetical protein [uncultured Tateyamaria sp.]|uniref:hypothetical protein n=1 Tax=Tateyamaria sp. 1078 TaxID=3417464 RepID=UPI002603D8AA|nr:hypothetical protein [uncultured Tateyamaria sp.]